MTEPAAAPAPTQPSVDLFSFERWSGETLSEAELNKLQKKARKKREQTHDALLVESPLGVDERFAVDLELNRMLILSKSDLTRIDCDAIVNPSNESLTSQHGVSADILKAAGPELLAEMQLLEGCKTGHAKLTKGYALPAKHIIHTVGPRYNAKYQTAAENALHNCYKNCMEVMRENKLRTLVLSVVHSQRKGYPPELGAHIALRTVRRYLEHYRQLFDTVMFCMVEGSVDYSVYRQVMPLYFPRTADEHDAAKKALEADCGDEWGETLIAERQIRIAASIKSGDAAGPRPDATARRPVSFADQSTMVADSELRPSALATMSAPPDAARRRAVRQRAAGSGVATERREQYAAWLAASERVPLHDIAKLRYVYRAGSDALGREAVVLLGRQLPVKRVDLQRVLLYVVRVLAPLTGRPFSLIYLHGGVTSDNDPPFAWLRQLYGLLDYPHGSSLAAVYVVHPTFFLKVGFTLLSPFLSSSFNDKLHYIEGLHELFGIYSKDVLQLPEEIFKCRTSASRHCTAADTFVHRDDTALTGRKWV